MVLIHHTSLLALAFAGHTLGQKQDSSSALLSRGIEALGGTDRLEAIRDVTYVGGGIFRTYSLSQTFGLNGLDTMLAGAGRQNVTFSTQDGVLRQRIDRHHPLSPNFLFGRPNLEPMDFSMVVQDGDDGFAAVVEGSDLLFAPGAPPGGYKDGYLAALLINEATKMSPLLLLTILENNNHTARVETTSAGVELQAVYDGTLDLSVGFDAETHLPYLVRSRENHNFFGLSTNDLVVHDYKTVNGVHFPHRFKTVYNNQHVMSDYSVADVLVNTGVPSARLQGPAGRLPSNTPTRDPVYGFAEIGLSNGFYSWGEYTGTFANFTATQRWKDLPGAWHVAVTDAPSYSQLILEVGDNVIVLDAPPHQSRLVMRWVREKLGKSVTHIWPSHHHHDHAYGVADYVAAGARVIALDDAVSYYYGIPKGRFVTYSDERPLTLKDGKTQVTFMHMKNSVHSTDYGYVHVAPRCTRKNSSTLVFEADGFGTSNAAEVDHNRFRTSLDAFSASGIYHNATFVTAHGPVAPLAELIDVVGYPYPKNSPRDFKYLQSRCNRS
ncbi:hypothetical protein F66182_981 [Fusarium sp. NRRL 66182]|nr:hypothetical protein F66182_981 [Fusarium sp. NRRL 66182]